MKNMKIEINEQQPIEDVVDILGDKGYVLTFKPTDKPVFVTTNEKGGAGFFDFVPSDTYFTLTTLAELKEM